MKRPSKDSYYLSIAGQIARRATCLRRKIGAIIVKNDAIVSSGYAGAPRGTPNCNDLNECLRNKFKIKRGERYELCRSIHAEANAIINAARIGVSVLGSKLYMFAEHPDGTVLYDKPCKMCRRMIINAGIREVIVLCKEGIKKYKVKDWVREAKKDPFREVNEKGY